MREVLLDKLRKNVFLQVALDFIDLNDALKIVNIIKDEVEATQPIITEIGTPLLKASGMEGVKKIRETLGPDAIVLVDTKTADAADVEAEIVKRGGGNIMTVLAAMDDSTIETAVKSATSLDLLVQSDLINVNDVVKRAQELGKLGVDIIGFHVGLDVQRTKGLDITVLKDQIKTVSEFNPIISVAGGIKPENIEALLDLPINIYVVGSAITRSKDPKSVIQQLLKILNRK